MQADVSEAARHDLEIVAGPSILEPAMARISEEDTRRNPSFEFPKHTESLLGGSTTAEAFGQPKGLGKTQGLPQKRPGSAKAKSKSSCEMPRTFSTEVSHLVLCYCAALGVVCGDAPS